MKIFITVLALSVATGTASWAQETSMQSIVEKMDERQQNAQEAWDEATVCIEVNSNGECIAYAVQSTPPKGH